MKQTTVLQVNEATILLVHTILRNNGKPDATVDDAVGAVKKALEGLTE